MPWSAPWSALWRLLGACLALACLAAVSLGTATAQTPPALELQPDADASELAPFVRFAPVSTVAQTPASIAAQAERLRPLNSDVIQFGPAMGPVLVRVDVTNTGEADGRWVLFTGRGSFRDIQIWRLDEGGGALLLDGTDRDALRRNLRTYQAFSAEFSLAAGERARFAVVFDAADSTYLPLEILTFPTFFAERRSNIALVAAVVAGALGLIVLNIVFFVITGKQEFVWLGLAELAFAANTLHTEGYTTIIAFAGAPLASLAFGNAVKCAFAVFMAQFARSFLDTRRTFPRTDRLLRALIAAGALIILAHPLLWFGSVAWKGAWADMLFYGGWLVAIASTLGLPVVAVAATRRLGRQYWPLILAWGSLAVYVVYAAVASSGIVPGLAPLWHLAGPIGLFEAVMATLALGLHIRSISEERAALDAGLTESLRQRVAISEQSARLERERATALASLSDHHRLLHASGHDIRQVVFSLRSAATALDGDAAMPSLLQSSADYLEDVAATAMAVPIGGLGEGEVVALSAFRLGELLRPLQRIYEPLCLEARQTLVFDWEPGLIAITDRARLIRVMSNLISNAVKFADGPGKITISAARSEAMLRIEVVDAGRGLSPELCERLNTETHRVRADSTVDGSGTGFRQSRLNVERLGGRLRINPRRRRRGARASLHLPLSAPTMTLCDADALRRAVGTVVDAPVTLVDADRPDAGAPGSKPASGQHRARLAVTFDDTAHGRARAAGLGRIVLIKPLCLEMAHHPLLQTARDPAREAELLAVHEQP